MDSPDYLSERRRKRLELEQKAGRKALQRHEDMEQAAQILRAKQAAADAATENRLGPTTPATTTPVYVSNPGADQVFTVSKATFK